MDKYLIWSNEHRGWWKPYCRGYTPDLNQAGRYTREMAIDICQNAIPSSMQIGMPAEIPVREQDVNDVIKDQLIPDAFFGRPVMS